MVVAFLVKNGSLIMREATFDDLIVPFSQKFMLSLRAWFLCLSKVFATKGPLLAQCDLIKWIRDRICLQQEEDVWASALYERLVAERNTRS